LKNTYFFQVIVVAILVFRVLALTGLRHRVLDQPRFQDDPNVSSLNVYLDLLMRSPSMLKTYAEFK